MRVTNSFKELVPDYFIRKQTLTNAERYTTDRLKELEDVIMGAEDRLYTLEYELFCGVRDQIAGEVVGSRALPRPLPEPTCSPPCLRWPCGTTM